jgi:hypothetical protein
MYIIALLIVTLFVIIIVDDSSSRSSSFTLDLSLDLIKEALKTVEKVKDEEMRK